MKKTINKKKLFIFLLIISSIIFSFIFVRGLVPASPQPNIKNLTIDTNSLSLKGGCTGTLDISPATFSEPAPYYKILGGIINIPNTCIAKIGNLLESGNKITLEGVNFGREVNEYIFSSSGMGRVNIDNQEIYLKPGSNMKINTTNGKTKPFNFIVKAPQEVSKILECSLPVILTNVNVEKKGPCCYEIKKPISGKGIANINILRTIILEKPRDYAEICNGRVNGNFLNNNTASYNVGPFKNIQVEKGRVKYSPSMNRLDLPPNSILNDMNIRQADGTIINGENIQIGNKAWDKLGGQNNDNIFNTFTGELRVNALKKHEGSRLDDKFLFTIPKGKRVSFIKPSLDVQTHGESETLLFFDDYQNSIRRFREDGVNANKISGGLGDYFFNTGSKSASEQSFLTLNQNKISGNMGSVESSSSVSLLFENSNVAGFNLQENQYMRTYFQDGNEFILEDSKFIVSKDGRYDFENGKDKLEFNGDYQDLTFFGGRMDKKPVENVELYSYSNTDMRNYEENPESVISPNKKIFSGSLNNQEGVDYYSSSFSMSPWGKKPNIHIYKGKKGKIEARDPGIANYAAGISKLKNYYDLLKVYSGK